MRGRGKKERQEEKERWKRGNNSSASVLLFFFVLWEIFFICSVWVFNTSCHILSLNSWIHSYYFKHLYQWRSQTTGSGSFSLHYFYLLLLELDLMWTTCETHSYCLWCASKQTNKNQCISCAFSWGTSGLIQILLDIPEYTTLTSDLWSDSTEEYVWLPKWPFIIWFFEEYIWHSLHSFHIWKQCCLTKSCNILHLTSVLWFLGPTWFSLC